VVVLGDGEVPYDALVVATGATHSYFGHDEWEASAPGLKTIEDAVEMRRRFLLAFEAAERETDPSARRARLTFVVVGGGPTGVELAGAMSEMARRSIPRDFRSIDTTTARILLIEAQDRVLSTFDEGLASRARKDLEALGVEVLTGARVTAIDANGVSIGDQRIDAGSVFWAAGVRASPLAASLPSERDGQDRVIVETDLTVKGHPEIFVLGDLAKVVNPSTGRVVPGVAQPAIQMGKYAARVLNRECREGRFLPDKPGRASFVYHDYGDMATIGRARAVGVVFGIRLVGLVAWVFWAALHVMQLIGFRNKLIVMIQWAWAYVVFSRGARLITGDSELHLDRSWRQPGKRRVSSEQTRAAT
jgi:NADH dehydrogenase